MWNLQVQGADLSTIEDYAEECRQFSNRYHLSFSTGLAEAMQAGWIGPMKKDYAPVPMENKLKKWEEDNHIASAGSYYVHMALAHYYLGEYEKAQEFLDDVRIYLSGLTDNVLKRQWHVFLVLNALKLFEKGASTGSKDKLMAEVIPLIHKIEMWAALGPLLKPYLAFLYAEVERVTGNSKEARSLYLDAISIAHEHKYTFLEGHLNECLGELLRNMNYHAEGIYFTEAARLYRTCRADRKEINLIERYPEYFEEEKAPYANTQAVSIASYTLPNLDIDYLMKSSLAISAEIELDALLQKIMNIVIQASGAQHGYLLIEEGENLFTRAESHIREEHSVLILNQNLKDTAGICKAIVRYVHRTGERLTLSNASGEGIFKDNPEVQAMQLRSVLCIPVMKQSRMIGILYLENRLSDSVFTSERAQITELLTSQAAISIENSRLVEEMRSAEDQIKKSLIEKEALLKEVHHRVKNNLQIIQSMLNLQRPHIKDSEAVELFKESQNRVYSMALVHEKLYRSESLARVNLSDYIRSLTTNLFLSYGVSERVVRSSIFIEDITLDIDTVIPCALIINELVSNSLKHAYPDYATRKPGTGEIRITLHPSGEELKLIVGDNGVGLPKGFKLQHCESLGLKLVSALVKQLKGDIKVRSSGGTEFTIGFKAG
jgi:two-component sensor histidine kinase